MVRQFEKKSQKFAENLDSAHGEDRYVLDEQEEQYIRDQTEQDLD